MIEIDLLRPRIKPGWQATLEPRGWSAFISKRELVLAVVFLALGFSVLRLGFGLFELETSVIDDQASSVLASPSPSGDLGADTEPLGEPATLAGEAATPVDPAADPLPTEPAPGPSSLETVAGSPSEPASSQLGSPDPEPPPEEPLASPSGGELLQLRQVTQGDIVQVVLLGNGRPTYTTFRIGNPNRVVIDIPAFRVAIPLGQRSQAISDPSIKRVRVGQHQVNPPLARVVFDVVSFPKVDISSQTGSLRIRLSPAVE